MPDRPRPLFEFPTWDGKLVLAGLFIIGYYSLVLIMAWRPLPQANAGLVRDALLTLGPPIGLIFGALFRTTGAEERRDILRSTELQTAITAPAGPATEPEVLKDAVTTGVADALANAEPVVVQPTARPMAADGQAREWLDPPGTQDADPWPTR